MTMNNTLFSFAAVALVVGGCAAPKPEPTAQQLDAMTQAMMKSSFSDKGIAKLDRLNQDLPQKACSSDQMPAHAVVEQIQSQALASVQWPDGGRYLGDWKSGEKIAQSGRGQTWNDAADRANGGSCYNCHQISKEELSYGTIGPSLYHYGKTRGVSDPYSAASAPILQYTWVKLWNSKAYSACSNMPRFGHEKLLTQDQLRDIMALLLDPKSPVNQ